MRLCIFLRRGWVSIREGVVPSLSATLNLLRRCLLPASMRAWSPRGTFRRTSSSGEQSRRPAATGLGLTAGCDWPRWCGGVAVCWLDAESCCPWSRCRGYCRGVVVLGCAAGAWVPVGLLLGSVSTERNMSRYVRSARRSRWGSVHGAQLISPTRPGWLWRGVDGSCQFRVCSCVLGRCTRSVGNAPLLFGCSAPDRV